MDDYKLSSERCSQHVCGAAIGLYGGVGDIIYRRGAPGHCIFAAYTNQKIESDQRHNIWCRITRVHVPRPQGDRITILRTCHCAFVTSGISRLHPLRIRNFWYFQAPRVFGNVIYCTRRHRVDVATLFHGRLHTSGANTTAVWSHLHLCWESLHSDDACFSSGELKLSAHTYSFADALYL